VWAYAHQGVHLKKGVHPESASVKSMRSQNLQKLSSPTNTKHWKCMCHTDMDLTDRQSCLEDTHFEGLRTLPSSWKDDCLAKTHVATSNAHKCDCARRDCDTGWFSSRISGVFQPANARHMTTYMTRPSSEHSLKRNASFSCCRLEKRDQSRPLCTPFHGDTHCLLDGLLHGTLVVPSLRS